jgi:hypothetical protein
MKRKKVEYDELRKEVEELRKRYQK